MWDQCGISVESVWDQCGISVGGIIRLVWDKKCGISVHNVFQKNVLHNVFQRLFLNTRHGIHQYGWAKHWLSKTTPTLYLHDAISETTYQFLACVSLNNLMRRRCLRRCCDGPTLLSIKSKSQRAILAALRSQQRFHHGAAGCQHRQMV